MAVFLETPSIALEGLDSQAAKTPERSKPKTQAMQYDYSVFKATDLAFVKPKFILILIQKTQLWPSDYATK